MCYFEEVHAKVSKWENIVQNEKRTRIKKGNQGRSAVKRVGEKDTAFITQDERAERVRETLPGKRGCVGAISLNCRISSLWQ